MGGSSKKVTVGYKYHVGMHMVLCHGPVDKLTRISVDSRVAWEGLQEKSGAVIVSSDNLFGGEKREGGVSGTLDVEFGENNQSPNGYLQSKLGNSIPAFRKVVGIVLRQMYLGVNPYLKPWTFRCQRVHTRQDGIIQWYDEKAEIGIEDFEESYVEYVGEINFDGTEVVYGDDDGFQTAEYQGSQFFDNTYFGTVRFRDYDWNGNLLSTEDLIAAIDTEGTTESETFFETVYVRGARSTFFVADNSADRISFSSSGMDWFNVTSDLTTLNKTDPIVYNDGSIWICANNTDYIKLTGSTSTGYVVPGYVNHQLMCVQTDPVTGRTFIVGRKASSSDLQISEFDGDPENILWSQVLASSGSFQIDQLIFYAYGTYVFLGITNNLRVYRVDESGLSLVDTTNRLATTENVIRVKGNYAFNGKHLYKLRTRIPTGDMNPAHIIRECLTDPDWGMGYAESDVDDISFSNSADTLYTENMGISLLWDRQMPLEDFIEEILKHINASVYVSRTTGKFVLSLIRDDYSISSLPIFDEQNVSSVANANRPSIGELVNSVTVNYWDSATGEVASVAAQDQALMQTQGSVINTTVQYPGFTNQSIASRVALRDLRSLSTELLSCDIYASRDAADLNIGDAFVLDWPDLEINSVVMRVQGLELGDGKAGHLKVTAVEDIFATPNTGVVSESEEDLWQDPTTIQPLPSNPRIVSELPFYELVLSQGQDAANDILASDPDAGFMFAAGGRQGNEINGLLYTNSGAGFEEADTMDFSPYAYAVDDVGHIEETIYLTDEADMDLVEPGSIASYGSELLRIDSVGEDSNGTFITVGRGVLDTVPIQHDGGSSPDVIVFWGNYLSSDEVQYTSSEQIDAQILTTTGASIISSVDAPVDSAVMDSRAIRPYPPGNFKIDSSYFPETIDYGSVDLSWSHRDRLQQTSGTINDFMDGDIGPEAGTTYSLRIYGETGSLLREETGLTATSYSYLSDDELADSGLNASRPFHDYMITLSPTAYYELDESSGTGANDSSGNGNDGAYLGGFTLDQQPLIAYGSSVEFDGVNGKVDISGIMSDPAVVTIAAFVGAMSSNGLIFAHRSGATNLIQVGAQSTSELRFQLRSSGTALKEISKTGLDMVNNTYFVVAVLNRNTNQHKLYVDAVLEGTDTTSFSGNFSASTTLIGAYFNGSSYAGHIGARLDEVALFVGKELSQEEISELFNRSTENAEERLNGNLTFELESARNGYTSYQKHEHTVNRYGYGINYGQYYGGV